eukprot:295531_1
MYKVCDHLEKRFIHYFIMNVLQMSYHSNDYIEQHNKSTGLSVCCQLQFTPDLVSYLLVVVNVAFKMYDNIRSFVFVCNHLNCVSIFVNFMQFDFLVAKFYLMKKKKKK